MAQLQKLGLKTVPVLSRGDKYIFGQNTQQIIDFVGLNEDGGPQLSVDQLHARVDKFMSAAIELIPLMPYDQLGTHVPGRPRSYRTLAFHLFRVIDAFIGTNEGITLEKEMFAEEPAADAETDFAGRPTARRSASAIATGGRRTTMPRPRRSRPTTVRRPCMSCSSGRPGIPASMCAST